MKTRLLRIRTDGSANDCGIMPFVRNRAMLVLAFAWHIVHLCPVLAAEEEIKYPSPDEKFALRITEPTEADGGKIALIDKASGEVMVDLGAASRSQVLLWSPDSKWVAYGNRGAKESEVSVYCWNGSTFDEVPLPDDLPFPDIKFRKNVGSIRHYGAWLTPLKWSKPGELELSNEVLMLDRDSGADYTGVLRFTLAFDAQHHASVKKVGKTKTNIKP